MKYRIEYAEEICGFANGSKDLIEQLKNNKDFTVVDIRKMYKSGVADSVLEQYKKYIRMEK